jgi:PTH1 family peptidyl-tRNA hydrolase
MILIVGLGNPGEKYVQTRHNLGFMVVEELARKLLPVDGQKWRLDKKANTLVLPVNSRLVLVKPQSFMNASGEVVAKLVNYYRIDPSQLWVVHDEVDLPLGKIKIRKGGSGAGHHGVESIMAVLKTDEFVRFRLGIGRKGRGADGQVEAYVLRNFDVNEKTELKHLLKKTVKAIQKALEQGLERAMNEFNQ